MGSRRTRRRRDSRLQRLRRRLQTAFCCCFGSATEESDQPECYGGVAMTPAAPRCTARVESETRSSAITDTTIEREDSESGSQTSRSASPMPSASSMDTRREDETWLAILQEGQSELQSLSESKEEVPFGKEFYCRLHAKNLVATSIYWARLYLEWAAFQDGHLESSERTSSSGEPSEECSYFSSMSGMSELSSTSGSGDASTCGSTASSDTTWSWDDDSISISSGLTGLSSSSSRPPTTEEGSIRGFLAGQRYIKTEEEEGEKSEELGGVEFYITLHTRNIVDSAIIRAILEIELGCYYE